jgi:hypothetical protein
MKSLFSGLNIEKLLENLSRLVDIFSENSEAGLALKSVFEQIFQPIINLAASWLPKLRSALIQVEILFLQGLIAIKPYGSEILVAAEAVGFLAALVGGTLLVALAAIAAPIIIATALFAGLITAMYEMTNLCLEIGDAIVNGLVGGITGGASKVVDAIKNVAQNAINAAKETLSIHSPSKVFEEIGAYTGEGMAIGVQSSVPEVQGAMKDLASPDAAAASAGGSSSGSVSVSGNTFVFQGVAGMDDAESRFAQLFTRLLEGDVAQLGAEVPA